MRFTAGAHIWNKADNTGRGSVYIMKCSDLNTPVMSVAYKIYHSNNNNCVIQLSL